MNEHAMQTALGSVFEEAIVAVDSNEDLIEMPEELAGVDSVTTFEEAGVLTMNKGLVIRMKDDSEYQLTIIKSR